MRTVTRDAFLADPAAAFAIADADGQVGLLGDDGKVSAVIGHPLEAKEEPEVVALRARVSSLEEVVVSVRRDLASYRDDYPNGTRFALTEIALQCLDRESGK